jgi:prepilin-type N-terminal cleavage/methylation domain-containing protein
MRRGDDGVTLIELLVCLAISGILASALATSFFASTRSIDQSSVRMADTHDSQMAASFFSSDVQGARWVWTATPPPFPGFSTCGSGGSLVSFASVGSDSGGNPLTTVATYRVITQDGERQLVRNLCSGPVVPSTGKSTVVIAHNLNGTPPRVDCFDPGNTKLSSCEGSNVFVAQLTAQAQASATDTPGFDYVLRATRRPTLPTPSTPVFVQATQNEVRSGPVVAKAFDAANTTGNLIVAFVVWNNTGGVSVSDSSGRPYVAATGQQPWGVGNAWSAQTFYLENIAGGANTVRATFATNISSSGFGIVYIHEYSGLAKANSVDVSASNAGSGSNMSSGSKQTTSANDLLFGGGASRGDVDDPGAGFRARAHASICPASDPDCAFGNLTEDRIVASTGSYDASANQSSDLWVMQLVAFRADTGGAP